MLNQFRKLFVGLMAFGLVLTMAKPSLFESTAQKAFKRCQKIHKKVIVDNNSKEMAKFTCNIVKQACQEDEKSKTCKEGLTSNFGV